MQAEKNPVENSDQIFFFLIRTLEKKFKKKFCISLHWKQMFGEWSGKINKNPLQGTPKCHLYT